MIYKLFIFGEKELFAYTEIFDQFIKEGDVFLFNGRKYKVLRHIRSFPHVYFEGDKIKRSTVDLPQQQFVDEFGPSLIITEIPEI